MDKYSGALGISNLRSSILSKRVVKALNNFAVLDHVGVEAW